MNKIRIKDIRIALNTDTFSKEKINELDKKWGTHLLVL